MARKNFGAGIAIALLLGLSSSAGASVHGAGKGAGFSEWLLESFVPSVFRPWLHHSPSSSHATDPRRLRKCSGGIDPNGRCL